MARILQQNNRRFYSQIWQELFINGGKKMKNEDLKTGMILVTEKDEYVMVFKRYSEWRYSIR